MNDGPADPQLPRPPDEARAGGAEPMLPPPVPHDFDSLVAWLKIRPRLRSKYFGFHAADVRFAGAEDDGFGLVATGVPLRFHRREFGADSFSADGFRTGSGFVFKYDPAPGRPGS
jgi:hypothetical protein